MLLVCLHCGREYDDEYEGNGIDELCGECADEVWGDSGDYDDLCTGLISCRCFYCDLED